MHLADRFCAVASQNGKKPSFGGRNHTRDDRIAEREETHVWYAIDGVSPNKFNDFE
jgi:hypothetical protein